MGAAAYMADSMLPLHVRLLSLFHGAQPVLILWALRTFGYDRRAFRYQAVTAWIVLPICFLFTAAERDLNWVWGPFDSLQAIVAPWLYFLGVMLGYPLLVYLPSHLALAWLVPRWRRARSK